MRINKLVAQATGLSRRAADRAIQEGKVTINRRQARVGDMVAVSDNVRLNGQSLNLTENLAILLNKPTGYVCSRNGQGSPTVYELLPSEYYQLKPVGRLDKGSSGLLLLTNDGDLANQLTHPRYAKTKIYKVALDRPLSPAHQQLITGPGVRLNDGSSQLALAELDTTRQAWQVTMHEGRNRQIRRTFAALGYKVTVLHRTRFGAYRLAGLQPGRYKVIEP